MAAAKQKAQSEMNDTIKKQAEAAFEQGKAAMDEVSAKSREAVEELNTLVRGNFDTFVESGRAAAQGFEALTQSAVAFARENVEAASGAARTFATAKSPNELFQFQGDFARAQFDRAVAEGSKMAEMLVKLSGEMLEPFSNRMSVAAERFGKVAAR
jgi:phasin family protein